MPFDISEATYLMLVPSLLLSTTELISRRAIAIQKRPEQIALLRSTVFQERVEAARRVEQERKATICDFDFGRGRLVLMRNTAIEKSLNRKMRPRYLGPYVVLRRNRGGAYVLAELDGAVFDRPVAAFRLVPYLARNEAIPVPVGALDVTEEELDAIADRAPDSDSEAEVGEVD
ncbi:hypothetical protein L227DRAFT_612784 [Lentinus tigrinus ALCF2SS1-6]|uniref:Uncharacterized protein n=1 Tax=Lentinus tigrinus ALCF2SS1-6 TaxID=1328759 RepID=A0A5C2SBK9_9APHY|nr:hypothetical protein L227DRAFT_612784 [Lentinus tigrinus ALCF2SS1-6]